MIPVPVISADLQEYVQAKQSNLTVHLVRQALDQERIEAVAGQSWTRSIDLIVVGRFIPKKGIPWFIQTLSAEEGFKGLTIAVVGSGPMHKEIQDSIGISTLNNVRMIQWQDHQQALELIAQSKILVVPSIDQENDKEGIPTVIAEAAMLNTPVISSNCGAVQEVLGDAFIFKQGNSRELTDRLKWLMDASFDQELWLGERNRILANYGAGLDPQQLIN